MVSISNVSKTFGSNPILRGISMDIEKGDVVVVLGPSGSGKTTLLRCISFLEHADEGELEIGGKTYNLRTANKRQMLEVRKQIAFVFQNHNLFQNKTALENVTEGLIIGRKMSKKDAEIKALEALSEVGLKGRSLSFTAVRRTAIACGDCKSSCFST